MSDYTTNSRQERQERDAYRRKGRRSVIVPKTGDPEEIAYRKRAGIGGNGAPSWDPEGPPTMPYVMRDIGSFRMQDGTEITSRSQLREFERTNKVEQIGLDYSGETKPWWHDEYKAHRRENEKRRKQGKPTKRWQMPTKPKPKTEKYAVGHGAIYDAKTMRKLNNV